MNILYVISATFMGGATISFLTLIKGIKEKGINVFVIIPDDRKEFTMVLNKLGIKYFVTSIDFSVYPRVKSKWDYIRFTKNLFHKFYRIRKAEKEIIQIVKSLDIDIIHTNVGPIRVGYNCAKKLKIPHVWHIREYGDLDFNMHEIPTKSYFQKLLKNSYVITITQDLLRYNKLESSPNACVIYNGVMCKKEASYNPLKEKYFLCASRISPEKGIHEVIKIFGEFCKNNKDFKLKILGAGADAYINELKRIAKEAGCLERVEFLGFQKNIKDYMTKATALVVASKSEGFGRMTAEAYFCGCLVVGRNTAGTKEILNETGGFPFNNSQEMLEQLVNVSELDANKYKNMAMYAQHKAIELYSNESYIDSVYELYEKIRCKEI